MCPAGRVLGGERTEAEHDRREAIRLEGELGMLREQRNTAAERRAQLSREIDQLREQVRAEQQGWVGHGPLTLATTGLVGAH